MGSGEGASGCTALERSQLCASISACFRRTRLDEGRSRGGRGRAAARLKVVKRVSRFRMMIDWQVYVCKGSRVKHDSFESYGGGG